MEYQEFVRRSNQAAELVKAVRLKEAVDAYYQLILSDISDIDKARLSASLAEVYDRLGTTEEALDWYDKGSAYERIYARYEVTEMKAAYLSSLGRNQEAIAIHESLLKQPFLSEAEKDRLHKALKELLNKSLGTWR